MSFLSKNLINVVLLASLVTPNAFADVPVIDATQDDASANAETAALPVNQRVGILERQMQHLTQMDMTAQINNLQQEVQKLRGQLDVQKHEMQQLTEQMRTQYQDLDRRVQPDKKMGVTQTLTDSTATNPPPSTQKTAAPVPADPNKVKPVAVPTEPPQAGLSENAMQEQKMYQVAYNYLRNRDYVRASSALQAFLSKYPEGDYTPNAHYWLGEIYLIQGQPDPAAREFNTVVSKYPTNSKVPDAMLKLGFAYYDKGDWDKARTTLTNVKTRFPGTTTAQLATARLQQIKPQGVK